MIRTDTNDPAEATALGLKVKREVNKRYRLLEIEQDALYKCMLLLKKKKYAAIKLERDAAGRTVEACNCLLLCCFPLPLTLCLPRLVPWPFPNGPAWAASLLL